MCLIDKQFENNSHNEHTCLVFKDFEDYQKVLCSFIGNGLKCGEIVICAIDEYDKNALVLDLEQAGIPVSERMEAGQLILSSIKDTYKGAESFEPENALDGWLQLIDKYKEAKGIRIMGEATFALDGKDRTLNQLILYEILMNKKVLPTFDKHQYLCVYNANLYPKKILQEIITCHTSYISADAYVKDNPFYVDTDQHIETYKRYMQIDQIFNLTDIELKLDLEKRTKS